jgi:hypothetical protein
MSRPFQPYFEGIDQNIRNTFLNLKLKTNPRFAHANSPRSLPSHPLSDVPLCLPDSSHLTASINQSIIKPRRRIVNQCGELLSNERESIDERSPSRGSGPGGLGIAARDWQHRWLIHVRASSGRRECGLWFSSLASLRCSCLVHDLTFVIRLLEGNDA